MKKEEKEPLYTRVELVSDPGGSSDTMVWKNSKFKVAERKVS